MTYWKAIINQETVDVGFYFMEWISKNKLFAYCDFTDAQFVQSSLDENKIYHCCWFRPENGVKGFIEADDIKIIDQTEYDELYALLSEGEPVVEPAPILEMEPEQEPESVDDHPMTIHEMRDKITELTELIYGNSNPVPAPQNYAENEVFAIGLKFYQASTVIVKGETVVPGQNCQEISIASVINSINNK